MDATHRDPSRNPLRARMSASAGALAAVPIVLGYFPYAFAFGILARQVGLTLEQTLFMSLIVYAGSSQILALGMLQAGQAIASIVAATFLFNLRFFLMSASLAPHIPEWSFWKRTLLGSQVADESFALLSSAFAREKPMARYAFAVYGTTYLAWSLFSVLGFLASGFVPDVRAWGLDYALPAVFVGLLICLIQDRIGMVVALFSAVAAVAVHLGGFQQSSLMVPAMLGALLGASLESWTGSSPSPS